MSLLFPVLTEPVIAAHLIWRPDGDQERRNPVIWVSNSPSWVEGMTVGSDYSPTNKCTFAIEPSIRLNIVGADQKLLTWHIFSGGRGGGMGLPWWCSG